MNEAIERRAEYYAVGWYLFLDGDLQETVKYEAVLAWLLDGTYEDKGIGVVDSLADMDPTYIADSIDCLKHHMMEFAKEVDTIRG